MQDHPSVSVEGHFSPPTVPIFQEAEHHREGVSHLPGGGRSSIQRGQRVRRHLLCVCGAAAGLVFPWPAASQASPAHHACQQSLHLQGADSDGQTANSGDLRPCRSPNVPEAMYSFLRVATIRSMRLPYLCNKLLSRALAQSAVI